MAKRPRPRKRVKKGGGTPDKHEQAAVAELAKHAHAEGDAPETHTAPQHAPPDAKSAAAHGPRDDATRVSGIEAAASKASSHPLPPQTALDADASDDEGPQKKRKRTRKRKKEPKAGPDPETLPELGEAARRALVYAQTYFRDKAAWKFSKPRQNWLMRHILWSQPIHATASALAAAPEEDRAQLAPPTQALASAALQLPEAGAWVPDEHVSVVAVYLQSIMGLAKQRMLDTLQEAARAHVDAPSVPTEQASSEPVALHAPGTPGGEASAPEASAPQASAPQASPPEAPAEASAAGNRARTVDVHALIAEWTAQRAARAAETLHWMEARAAAP